MSLTLVRTWLYTTQRPQPSCLGQVIIIAGANTGLGFGTGPSLRHHGLHVHGTRVEYFGGFVDMSWTTTLRIRDLPSYSRLH